MLQVMESLSKPLIYLASASPRRSALLAQIGVCHAVRPVEIDEATGAGESPGDYVARLAARKAQTLWSHLGRDERLPVLGADTSVALADEIMGKPRDESDATRMLERLSSRTHQVYTAVALCSERGCATQLSVSEVSFRALERDEIRAYWRTGEPQDKAGAYAVQGLAALFIERISGSFSGIMGLPLFETGELLRSIGWRFESAAG